MRKVIAPQMQLGELPIAAIKLDPKSRDDIPQILRGLQHIYTTPELRGPILLFSKKIYLSIKSKEKPSRQIPITVVPA